MAAVSMEHLRATLKRVLGTTADAGDAGEELTRRLLDEADISWFFVEQDKDTKSKRLRRIGGKRTDLVVAWDGACLLLDAKCQTPIRGKDGSFTYFLERAEIDRLKITGAEFGMEVAVIFWDRTGQAATYAIDFVSRLDQPGTIKGQPALGATFGASEVISVKLYY